MVLAAHHFRSHVTWSTACVLTVIRLLNPSDTEICDPYIPILVENQVLGFDVPVDYIVVMEIFKRDENAGNEKSGLIFFKFSVFPYMESQITPS